MLRRASALALWRIMLLQLADFVEAGLKGVEFIAVNTDKQALLMSQADKTIHIGEE